LFDGKVRAETKPQAGEKRDTFRIAPNGQQLHGGKTAIQKRRTVQTLVQSLTGVCEKNCLKRNKAIGVFVVWKGKKVLVVVGDTGTELGLEEGGEGSLREAGE